MDSLTLTIPSKFQFVARGRFTVCALALVTILLIALWRDVPFAVLILCFAQRCSKNHSDFAPPETCVPGFSGPYRVFQNHLTGKPTPIPCSARRYLTSSSLVVSAFRFNQPKNTTTDSQINIEIITLQYPFSSST